MYGVHEYKNNVPIFEKYGILQKTSSIIFQLPKKSPKTFKCLPAKKYSLIPTEYQCLQKSIMNM